MFGSVYRRPPYVPTINSLYLDEKSFLISPLYVEKGHFFLGPMVSFYSNGRYINKVDFIYSLQKQRKSLVNI